VQPANGRTYSLEELQAIVGGFIEVVWTTGGELMIVNEDGISLGLPFNSLASSYHPAQRILGDVAIVAPGEIE